MVLKTLSKAGDSADLEVPGLPSHAGLECEEESSLEESARSAAPKLESRLADSCWQCVMNLELS